MAAKNDNQPRFEDAISGLEDIIEKIETGEIGLEESLLQYEKGMKLVTRCRGILDSAEKKIAELTADAQGRLTIDAPLDPAEQALPDEAEAAPFDDGGNDASDDDSDEEVPF